MQVILNLQSNALKFTESGKVEIVVQMVSEEVLKISVKDSGIGIHELDKEKLFKLFGFVQDSR